MDKLQVVNNNNSSEDDDDESMSENENEKEKSNNYDLAVSYFTKEINNDNKNPEMLINRATCHLAKGFYSLSLKDSLKTIELSPNFQKGYYFAALSYLEMFEFEKAEKIAKKDKNQKILLLINQKKKAIKEKIQKYKSYPLFLNMIKELYKSDAFFPKIDILYITEEYRGIVATSNIQKDEIILIIPFQNLISLEMALETSIGKEIGKFIYIENELASPKHSLLSSFLLSQENNPKWKFYFDLLPKDFSSFPIFYTYKEFEYLKGSPFLNIISNKKKDLKKDYEKICDNIPSFKKYSFQKFCEARMIVSSRVFGIEINDKKTDVLVPFADLLNHKRPRQTHWYFNNILQGFVIQALQDIKEGNEIFDSYGIKPNFRFLLNYGFVIEDNDTMEFVFTITFNSNYPLYIDKINCFRSHNDCIKSFNLHNIIEKSDLMKLLSFLRFSLYTGNIRILKNAMIVNDSSNEDEQTFSYYEIDVLSQELEITVLKHFHSLLEQTLSNYPTTYDQDKNFLNKKDLSFNQRNCIILTMNEKYVLLYYIYFCEYCLSLFKISIVSKFKSSFLTFNNSQFEFYINKINKFLNPI